MSENTSKSAFVEGVGHFDVKYQVEGCVYTANIYTPLDRPTEWFYDLSLIHI